MANGAIQELAELAGRRAENLFSARGLCCAESVLVMGNQAFGGGLTPEQAVRLGAGFCHGMGGAGCVCGALASGQMVLGLLLGPGQAGGLEKKEFQKVSQELHDRFKERFGATCCRVLTKWRKEKKGATCQEITGGGAALLTSLLLANLPELAARADRQFLTTRDSKSGALLTKAMEKE